MIELDEKFSAFHAFADHYAPVTRGPLGCWRAIAELNGVRLELIGLNSVWTGGSDDLDKPGYPVVGDTQREAVAELATGADETDVTLVLQHNPVSYLNSIDALQHANWLDDHDGVVFCGHLHQSSLAERRSMRGRHIEMLGGALYADYADRRRYSLGSFEIGADERHFAVALRAADADSDSTFGRDPHRYPGAREGIASFAQRKDLPILGRLPPERDQLEIDLKRATLQFDGDQYHVEIEKIYRNPTNRPWTHIDALVLANAFPNDPVRSRALYHAHPIELREIGFFARCDGKDIPWLVLNDLDSTKELHLVLGQGTDESPGIEPGESATLVYGFSIDKRYWGPYFERHIRRPTRRIECRLQFPSESVIDMQLTLNPNITNRILTGETETETEDTSMVWRWSSDDPDFSLVTGLPGHCVARTVQTIRSIYSPRSFTL